MCAKFKLAYVANVHLNQPKCTSLLKTIISITKLSSALHTTPCYGKMLLHYEKCHWPKYIFYEIVFIFVQNVSNYIFPFMSTSFFFVHLKIYNSRYSLLQMKTSYLTFLEMIQILATYHYQILLLDNIRKSPLVKSNLLQRSLSQALCVCVNLFRKCINKQKP